KAADEAANVEEEDGARHRRLACRFAARPSSGTGEEVMRQMVLAALLLAMAVTAHDAEARPDVRKMTCAEANAIVAEQGAVVMTTGQHTYRRFVSNRAYCEFDQVRRTYIVTTRDNPRCRLNGICDQTILNDFPGFRD
ncbi:MAG: hypothetical protein AAFW98_06980, partial [Pseudomonadota bacterium]